MAFTPDDKSQMEYTVDIRRFLGETHGNRPIMSRDQDPRGKVFYTTAGGEAIVVDPTKYPEVYKKWYREFEDRARGNKRKGVIGSLINRANGGTVQEEVVRPLVLQSAFDLVSEKMKYSKQGVQKILQEENATKDGAKVELSIFMDEGVGVCRHQALAVATLLSEAKDNGHIRGDISVDRSEQWSPDGDRSGHAWVRYTSHSGTVMILDVAQGFMGTLEESRSRPEGWNYLRPEDTVTQQAAELGGTAVNQIIDRVPGFERPEAHVG